MTAAPEVHCEVAVVAYVVVVGRDVRDGDGAVKQDDDDDDDFGDCS